MTTKEIEKMGIKAFKKFLSLKYNNGVNTKDVRSDREYGCDLIVTHNNIKYYFEIKASESDRQMTNLRFAHQTISTMFTKKLLSNMRVAYVYNLKAGIKEAKFLFFRFGDIPKDKIIVEPHFIVKPGTLPKENTCVEDPFIDKGKTEDNIKSVFGKPIQDFMKLEKGVK